MVSEVVVVCGGLVWMTFSIGMQGNRSLPGTRGTGVHDLATKCTVGGPKLLLLLV